MDSEERRILNENFRKNVRKMKEKKIAKRNAKKKAKKRKRIEKIHAKVDWLGMAMGFIVTSGQSHEIKEAQRLISNQKCDYLLADRGYDCDSFRESLKDKGIIPVIPGRNSRKKNVDYDKHIYKERNIIERFFARIK